MSGEDKPDKPSPVPVPVPGDPALAIAPAALLAAYHHARRAFPAECCGWITGAAGAALADTLRPCTNAQTDGAHPTVAGRTAESAYVIAGDELLAFARAFRDAAPPRVIYHSHPNGRAYFSSTDREVATSPWGDGPAYPVHQLVIGIDERRVVEAALFAWSDDAAGFVEVARLAGADV